MAREKTPNEGKQDIETLRQRFESLRDQRTTAQAHLKSVEEQLQKLRNQAREKYGTDDLVELQKQLERMRAENESKRAAYQAHLDSIDERLRRLEEEAAP